MMQFVFYAALHFDVQENEDPVAIIPPVKVSAHHALFNQLRLSFLNTTNNAIVLPFQLMYRRLLFCAPLIGLWT